MIYGTIDAVTVWLISGAVGAVALFAGLVIGTLLRPKDEQ